VQIEGGSDAFEELAGAVLVKLRQQGEEDIEFVGPSSYLFSHDGEDMLIVPDLKVDDDLVNKLVTGIEKSGGLLPVDAPTTSVDPKQLKKDVRNATGLLRKSKEAEAALLISKYFPSTEGTDDSQMMALKKLTGLKERPPMLGPAFDGIVKKLSKKLTRLGDRAVEAGKEDAALPETDTLFENWWNDLTESSGVDSLREQGVMIDKANQHEDDQEQAIEAYQQVIDKYPDSSAALLCEKSISLLKNPSTVTNNSASRVWHSKKGSQLSDSDQKYLKSK